MWLLLQENAQDLWNQRYREEVEMAGEVRPQMTQHRNSNESDTDTFAEHYQPGASQQYHRQESFGMEEPDQQPGSGMLIVEN